MEEAHIHKLDLDSVNFFLRLNPSRPQPLQLISLFKADSNNNKQVPSDIACNSISTSLHCNSKYVAEVVLTTSQARGSLLRTTALAPIILTPPLLRASAVYNITTTTIITVLDLVPIINRTTPQLIL
jgi:hypothetical protein